MALPSEAEILSLSPEERVRLIELLWSSIVDHPETLPVDEAQRRELRRRLEAHDADPSEARPWSEVRSELETE